MTNRVIAATARFVSLLSGGLFTGFLLTVLVIELTVRGYGAAVYTQVRQVELVHLDDLASATLIPTLIAVAVLVASAVRVRGQSFWLALTAFLLLATVFVTSLILNIPINQD